MMKHRPAIAFALVVGAATILGAYLVSVYIQPVLSPSTNARLAILVLALVGAITFLGGLIGALNNYLDLWSKLFPVEVQATTQINNVERGEAAKSPPPTVTFTYQILSRSAVEHTYQLATKVGNQGNKSIAHFNLEFVFPDKDMFVSHRTWSARREHIVFASDRNGKPSVSYQSRGPLHPGEEVDVGGEIQFKYKVNTDIYWRLADNSGGPPLSLNWTLYVDDMSPVSGQVPMSKLHEF